MSFYSDPIYPINGLYYDPNHLNSGSSGERDDLLRTMDWIRLGLAGNLSDFPLTDRFGNQVVGSQVDYLGQGAGYASDPQETINYAAAHDNETLYDINQYKLALTTSMEDRVRVQNLANSIIALSQGVPFFHAGQDMLRSKSMGRNSFDSGDWFNLLDFTYPINGFGRGLPPARDYQNNWSVAGPLLANPSLAPGENEIRSANRHMREMLKIRRGSQLFRLTSAREVIDRVEFHNTGPEQIPGLLVMSIRDDNAVAIVVLFNARTDSAVFTLPGSGDYDLHLLQKASADPLVRTSRVDHGTGQFHVPARTTAVFVRQR